MSKKSKKQLAATADGEFMTLIRCQSNTVTLHDEDNEPAEDVSYWRSKYEKLKKETDAAFKKFQRKIDHLEKSLTEKDEKIDFLQRMSVSSGSAKDEEDDEVYQELLQYEAEERQARRFSRGLGLSVKPGEDPKLYRLSEPDGDLIPKRKFQGAEFEIQPGRGFQIRIHRG